MRELNTCSIEKANLESYCRQYSPEQLRRHSLCFPFLFHHPPLAQLSPELRRNPQKSSDELAAVQSSLPPSLESCLDGLAGPDPDRKNLLEER